MRPGGGAEEVAIVVREVADDLKDAGDAAQRFELSGPRIGLSGGFEGADAGAWVRFVRIV